MQTLSYSKPLIRFILLNYIDIAQGASPAVLDEAKTFTKSVKAQRSPQDTITCWKSDCDAAISSLAPKRDIWSLIATGITPSMLQHAGRHPQVSAMQRAVITICMLDPCAGCSGRFRAHYCSNNNIIRRMQDYLNGKVLNVSAKHP